MSLREQSQVSVSEEVIGQGVIYLLALVVLVQFGYPITYNALAVEPDRVWLTFGYQVLYAGMCVAGIYVACENRRYLYVTVGSALLFLLFSFFFVRDLWLHLGNPLWPALTYASVAIFQISIIGVLLRYIFLMPRVTRDVLFAAVTVYLLLGAIFVPVYGLMETLQPGSLLDNAAPVARAIIPGRRLSTTATPR